jgi:hypothetical protein
VEDHAEEVEATASIVAVSDPPPIQLQPLSEVFHVALGHRYDKESI